MEEKRRKGREKGKKQKERVGEMRNLGKINFLSFIIGARFCFCFLLDFFFGFS